MKDIPPAKQLRKVAHAVTTTMIMRYKNDN